MSPWTQTTGLAGVLGTGAMGNWKGYRRKRCMIKPYQR